MHDSNTQTLYREQRLATADQPMLWYKLSLAAPGYHGDSRLHMDKLCLCVLLANYPYFYFRQGILVRMDRMNLATRSLSPVSRRQEEANGNDDDGI